MVYGNIYVIAKTVVINVASSNYNFDKISDGKINQNLVSKISGLFLESK